MGQILIWLFQFLPPVVAYAFLGLFSVLLIFLIARIIKIILDAIPLA